jgi:hypothetical protein
VKLGFSLEEPLMARPRTILTASILTLALLAAPLTAAPLEKSPLSFTSWLASFWEMVMVPLSGISEKSEDTEGRLSIDPDGAATDPTDDTTERRLGIDPNGATTDESTEGRLSIDPNG